MKDEYSDKPETSAIALPDTIILSAAYGRHYTSRLSLIEDFRKGKDFKIENPGVKGQYLSKRDLNNVPRQRIEFRYGKQNQHCWLSTVRNVLASPVVME